MRIALIASEIEPTPEQSLLRCLGYAHKIARQAEADYLFFPLGAIVGEREPAFLRMLAREAAELDCPIGVGFQEKKGGVYCVFFPNGKIEETSSFCQLDERVFLSLEEEKKGQGVCVLLKKDPVDMAALAAKVDPSHEVYFLGCCEEGFYQCGVYEHGAIKCRLPQGQPNILLKSVPPSGK